VANITLKMRDGTTREFRHEGRSGGSYTKRMQLEGAFVVVVDEWGVRTAIPAELVAEAIETLDRSW